MRIRREAHAKIAFFFEVFYLFLDSVIVAPFLPFYIHQEKKRASETLEDSWLPMDMC